MRINKLNISPIQKKALQESWQRLKAAYPIKKMVIYGSVARGDATAESDIDLLVITEKRMTHRQRLAMCDIIFEVNLTYGTTISILVVDLETWQTGLWSVLSIKREIEHNGIPL
jgi:predicted nucleotidyltransferase